MKFVSEKYPELWVHDLGVRFRDGEAEVSEKDKADALKRLPKDLGVRAIGGRPSAVDENAKAEADEKAKAGKDN